MAGCNDAVTDTAAETTESTGSDDAPECVEPENPYNDDGGHDAGFKWAEENGEACDGNSESFHEGCQEYHEQLIRFEECKAGKDERR
jgi:hypothetical protein